MSGSGTDDPQVCSTPESPRLKQAYVCDICGAKLSRAAHLHRHQKLHSTTSELESFECQLCGKRFTRKDVYQRHKRSVHGPAQTRRNSRKKSCHRCIRYKLRCSRELPCTACLDRHVQCFYDARPPATGTQVASEPVLDDPPRAETGPVWQTQTLDVLASAADFIGQSTEDGSHALMPSIATEHMQTGSELDTWNLLNGAAQYHEPGSMAVDAHAPPFPQLEGYDWDMLRSSRMDWLGCETEASDDPVVQSLRNAPNFEPELDHAAQMRLTGLGMNDLYNTPIYESDHQHKQPSSLQHHTTTDVIDSSPVILASSNSCPTKHVQANFSRSKDKENRDTWPAVLDRGGNETWPFDYTSNKGFRKITLPPLREVLEQTVGHRPSIEKNTLHDLIKILSAPQIPSLNDTPALEALPAIAFLGEFVKIYFAEFHAVLPIIHTPTWRIEKCPTALLAAMACIGATYSTADGSNEVAALLAEITQRALFWMGQQDSTAFRNSAYITASCFHQIYALGTGNRRLYEIADASRGLLVTSLRGLGILSSDTEHTDASTLDPKQLKRMDPPALEAAWLQWRDKEMEKRMAWSVFEFDCVLSTLTSKRGAFRIAELPSRLPCCENIWTAHSAQAWAAILPFATSSPAGLSCYPLLQDLIAGKPVPQSAPAWSRRLCIHAISRTMYDVREVEDAGAPNMLGLSALASAHQDTKQRLLRTLLSLEASLSRPTCTSEIVNMNIATLTTHHTHLISTPKTLDLVIYIFRHASRTPSRDLDTAKDQLRYTFARDPASARRLAFHAAAIVGTARECAINTPCETMRVFFGYAFLMAFVKFFGGGRGKVRQRLQGGNGGGDVGQQDSDVVRLDHVPWTRTREGAERVQRWIDVGGSAGVEGVSDICDPECFGEVKGMALRAMRELGVWGIAGKFCKTIGNFG